MKINETSLPGCFEIIPEIFTDLRGSFVKTFRYDVFAEAGLQHTFAEEYYSVSKKNVLRGMHFQTPPFEHAKLVYCLQGCVWDVVTDLRKGSPTFGSYYQTNLSAERANILYIPVGLAHGFFTVSEQAIMVYKTTSQYERSHDTGILWNSLDIDWPVETPLISERDSTFPAFSDYESPFVFEGN